MRNQHYPDLETILVNLINRLDWKWKDLAGAVDEEPYTVAHIKRGTAGITTQLRFVCKVLERVLLLPHEKEFFERYAQWCKDRNDRVTTETWEDYWYISPQKADLTPEEYDVLRLHVEESHTNYEIARRMGMSVNYINRMLIYENSPHSLLYKIGVKDLKEAERWYKKKYGIRDTDDKRRYDSTEKYLTHFLSSPFTIILTVCYSMCLPIFFIIWIESARNCSECSLNYYSNIYLMVALASSVLGFVKLGKYYWSFKNFPLLSILLCFALLVWAIGNINWMYNNFKYGDSVPYPSWGDRLYLIHNLLWMIGVYWLQKALGAVHVRKTFVLLLVGAMLGMGLVALMWLLRGEQPLPDDPEKFFFDVGLPFASGMTFALMRLWRTDPSFIALSHGMKTSVRLIFLGSVLLFVADLGFSIGTLVPKGHLLAYLNGGWQDFFFATALYGLGLGVLSMPLQPMESMMTVSQLWQWLIKLASSTNKYLSDLMLPTGREEEAEVTQQKDELVSANAPVSELSMPVKDDTVPHWHHWIKDIFSPYVISLTVVYVTVFTFIFLPIWLQSCKTCFLNTYESLYLVMPLCGALFGVVRTLGRYGLSKRIPAPLILVCLALLLWSSGNMIWMYYKLVRKEELPYPSWADVSYFTHNLLWLVSVYILLNNLGVNVRRKLPLLWRFGGMLLGSLIVIMLFVRGWGLHSQDPLKFILDVSYPLISGFTVALVVLGLTNPSFKKLDNTMKRAIRILLLGIFLLFIADLSFNLIITLPDNHPWAYYNGAWPDFIYTTAFYVLGMGLLSLPLKTMKQMTTVKPLRQWFVKKVSNFA
jgi:hypothetical protein